MSKKNIYYDVKKSEIVPLEYDPRRTSGNWNYYGHLRYEGKLVEGKNVYCFECFSKDKKLKQVHQIS